MKKRTIPVIAVLLVALTLSLSSCSLISGLGGAGGEATKVSGKYAAIDGTPVIKLDFSGSNVTVSVGTRSMTGKYTVKSSGDSEEMVFDFADQTLPRCNIQTGSYPVSFGEQNGVEYMMIFGARYNKVK